MLAVVHDWILHIRGGEKSLKHILSLFNSASLFSFFFKPGVDPDFDRAFKACSFLNKLPRAHSYYRYLAPLFNLAVYELRKKIQQHDSLISVSHCLAKNVYLDSGQNVCYCLSPFRAAYDLEQVYTKGNVLKKFVVDLLRRYDQQFDRDKVKFIAISRFVAERIKGAYGVEPVAVVYPPCDTEKIKLRERSYLDGEYYITGGALVENKNIDAVIQAFNKLKLPLRVFGDGPLKPYLQRIAEKNVRFLGWISDSELIELFQKAKAFVFPSVEDFGMTTVEFLASGGPVVGLNRGGTREILDSTGTEGRVGFLLESDKTRDLVEEIAEVVNMIENKRTEQIDPLTFRTIADRFSVKAFKDRFKSVLYSLGHPSIKYLKAC